jgi:isoleucyl-tRNA synthetase
MESVIWGFKQLWDKGLVYRGYRVVPYSWAVQTPLSNFETRLDNSYRERQDPALTVGFLLKDAAFASVPTRLLAWTTTPWTLPSNLALAVAPDLDYAVLEKDGKRVILAEAALERYEREFGEWTRVDTLKGSALADTTYEPLFPYFKDTENAFKVLAADFVEAGDGTGCVHIAPGFGEDDFELAKSREIPLVVPVDEAGKFTAEVTDYVGQNVIEANKDIIRDLKAREVVYRHETYLHDYPHCWRTDTPLIYKAIDAWYVAVSQFKDRMVELNREIDWVPEHVRDGQFGKWLENARDWNISRNRFWGCPIPVWVSDDPNYPRMDVYGSLDEIEADFGVRPDDLHRPMIDELVRPNPDDPSGKAMMRRVPEVLDVWFDSGSMPFAQEHYPFKNKERFEQNFPADFIVEYVAQTRGWFYTLMVLSTAIFDRAPFRNAVCHGVVLDENKQKLSKRLQNYPDPVGVFDTYGADALRWYMLSSPLLVGGDLAVAKDGRGIAQSLRQAIIPIWSAYYFFTLYANADSYKARVRFDQKGLLDRYILAKTRELIEKVQGSLDAYDIPGAYSHVPGYIDALNNWYIRRSRSRFWGEEMTEEKRDALDTLYTVLTHLMRTLAPMMPFVSERIYKGLTGELSVHLADWPEAEALPNDPDLVRRMDLIRDICASVMSLREAKRLRARLPLKTLTVAHPEVEDLRPYANLIADEVNIKDVVLEADPLSVGEHRLAVKPQIGKRIGKKMKDVMAASKSGDWTLRPDGIVELAGVELPPEDYTMRVLAPEGSDTGLFDAGAGVVLMDTQLYPELEREGYARDIVRLIQQTRKDGGFNVSDRIRLNLTLPEELTQAVEEHRERIAADTLAREFTLGGSIDGGYSATHEVGGKDVVIEMVRIDA